MGSAFRVSALALPILVARVVLLAVCKYDGMLLMGGVAVKLLLLKEGFFSLLLKEHTVVVLIDLLFQHGKITRRCSKILTAQALDSSDTRAKLMAYIFSRRGPQKVQQLEGFCLQFYRLVPKLMGC